MIIQSKNVWLDSSFMPAQIEFEADRIKAVYEYGSHETDKDYGELRIVPGFIDIHTHGAYGFETNDGEPEGLVTWMKRLPSQEGVTAFLPSTITQSREVLSKALINVRNVKNSQKEGAEILGVHFEGPYIDVKYKGAQPEEFIRVPDIEELKYYQSISDNIIKYITVAPEHDEGMKFVRYCHDNGIVVSLGHSNATYEDAVAAVDNGASCMTHVFNGMTPLNHRKPGLAGAALRMRDVYGEMISDGYHVTPVVMNLFFHAKGPDHGIIITDSLACKGLPKGDYTSGGLAITVCDDGTARLKDLGNLAGSTLRMNKGIQIVVEKAGVPFEYAIKAATCNPAKLLGIDDRKGYLKPGYDADIIILDKDYEVVDAYARGSLQKA